MKNRHSKQKSYLKLISLMLSLFLLGGCWSSHEVNNLAIINAIGIDLADDGNYLVTMNTVRPEALFSFNRSETGSFGRNIQTPQLLTTTKGETIYDAIQKISNSLSKRLTWTTMDVLIIGEEIAQGGIEPVLDMLIRGPEFRPNIKIFVTKGTALDIMKYQPQLENTFGSELYNYTIYSRLHSTPHVADLVEFTDSLGSDTKDPLTGEISVAKENGLEKEEVGIEEGSPTSLGLTISSQAVFKRDKLIGWLNNKEARAVSLIRGTEQTGTIILDCPDQDGKLSFEITNSNSNLKPKVRAGKLEIDLDLNIDTVLREITCQNFHLDGKKMEELNKSLEEKIGQQITSVLNKVQKDWQTDIFGFGEVIYKRKPAIWKELEPTWRDGGLKDLEVNLHNKVNIFRSGLFYDPISADESR